MKKYKITKYGPKWQKSLFTYLTAGSDLEHSEGTQGGVYLDNICLPLGTLFSNIQDPLTLAWINGLDVGVVREMEHVLQEAGRLHSEERECQPPICFKGQNLGHVADERANVPSLLKRQLCKNEVPHLKDGKKRKIVK